MEKTKLESFIQLWIEIDDMRIEEKPISQRKEKSTMERRKLMGRAGFNGMSIALLLQAIVGAGCEGNKITDASIGTVAKIKNDFNSIPWKACLDQNRNYGCNDSEPAINVDETGRLFLGDSNVSKEDLEQFPVIVELRQGNRVLVTLSSLSGSPKTVSPLNTLLRVGTDLDRNSTVDDLEEELIERYQLNEEKLTPIVDFTTSRRSALFGSLLVATDQASDVSVKELYSIFLDDSNAQLAEDQFEKYVETVTYDGEASDGDDTGDDQVDIGDAPTNDAYSNQLWKQGMDFGVGYNDIDGTILSAAQCLERNAEGELEYVEGPAPMIETYRFELVHSKSDLRDRLKVDGKISLKLDSFQLNPAEAKFLDEFELNKNDLYIFAEMEMIFRDYMLKTPRLTLNGYSEIDNASGQQPGTIRYLYKSTDEAEMELFRQRCGDRFLNVISTGGRYWGLIKIETKNESDKMEIAAKLKLKISKFSLSGDVEIINNELSNYENVKIYIASRGASSSADTIGTGQDGESDDNDSNYVSVVSTLSQFYNNIATFKKNLMKNDKPDANGKRDYRKGAYLAKFESYDQIADSDLTKGGDVAYDSHCMEGFVDLLDEYTDVEHEGMNIIENPHLYEGALQVTTIDKVNDWLNRIRLNKAMVHTMAKQCSRKKNRKCVDLLRMEFIYDPTLDRNVASYPEMDRLHLEIPQKIIESYPQPKVVYPKTCKERKELFSRNQDDDYILYLGRNPEKKYFAYCQGMDNRPDETGEVADPVEYLTLRVTSPSPEYGNVRYNFANNIDYTKVEYIDETPIESVATQIAVYRKLRLHVTDTHLAVYPVQEDWFETNGQSFVNDKRLPATPGHFGTASSCSPKMLIGANINLQGTPFRIDVPNTVEYGAIASDSYQVLYNEQMSWDVALLRAYDENGRLPIIEDNEDKEFYRTLVNDFYLTSGTWLPLKTIADPSLMINTQEESYALFRWYDAPNDIFPNFYWNWWPGYNWEEVADGADLCAFLTPDGYFEYTSCTNELPIIVEHKRVVGKIEMSDQDGQVFDISVRSKAGGCGSYANINGEIELNYDENLAAMDPWLSQD